MQQQLQPKARPRFIEHLRGPPEPLAKDVAEETPVGGLRDACRSVQKVPGLQVWGPILYRVFSDFLDAPEIGSRVQRAVLEAVRTREGEGPAPEDVQAIPSHLWERITAELREQKRPYEPLAPPEDCDLDANLIAAWNHLAHDPGTITNKWFWEGAPAGIVEFPDVGPVFPPVQEGEPESVEPLLTSFNEFRNYAGVDQDPDVVK